MKVVANDENSQPEVATKGESWGLNKEFSQCYEWTPSLDQVSLPEENKIHSVRCQGQQAKASSIAIQNKDLRRVRTAS